MLMVLMDGGRTIGWISTRYFSWFMWLAPVFVMAFALLIVSRQVRQTELARVDATLLQVAGVRAALAERQLQALRQAAWFLVDVPPIQGLVRANRNHGFDAQENSPAAIWQRRLQQIFAAYLKANPGYLQVRLIGVADNGRELVRVDRKASTLWVVPAEQLQQKGDRDYFRATVQRKPLHVHISDFNLNQEYGKVVLPPEPTVRVATPVHAADGQLFGLVVLNVDADMILSPLRSALPQDFQLLVTNQDGDYLLHPDARLNYGFDLGQRHQWQDDHRLLPTESAATPVQRWQHRDGRVIRSVVTVVIPDPVVPNRNIQVRVLVDEAVVDAQVAAASYLTAAVLLLAMAIFAGFLLAFRRNAARRMQLALEKSRLAVIVESSADAIIGIDLTGWVTSWNTGAERIFATPAKVALGQPLLAILQLPAALTWPDLQGRLLAGEVLANLDAISKVCADTSAAAVEVSATISPIRDDSGQVVSASVIARDVSAQKIAAAQIKALNANLEQQVAERTAELVIEKDHAEQASRAKSEFVANMSHEIRTPMNAVLGLTHLLGMSKLSAEQQSYLQMLRGAGESLLGVLNDVLDFSKLEAGRLEVVALPFQLCDVLDTVATVMAVNAADRDLELVITAEPDIPDTLVGDAKRLLQILINVVGNAIKFTESGEVVLSVQLLTLDTDQLNLGFRVRDTGIGMTAAQQARLFSAFSQADASITRRFGGTGLGLAISRHLTTLLGGTISCASTPGVGTEFHLAVPFHYQRQPAPALCRPVASDQIRLLVIDDNATRRAYLEQVVRSWCWQVDSVADLDMALQQAQQRAASAEFYHVVLLNWQLAQQAAYGALQQLFGSYPEPPVRLILINSFSQSRFRQDMVLAAQDRLLLKPVTSSSLFDALHEMLQPRFEPELATSLQQTTDAALRLDGVRLLLVEDNALNQFVARNILEQAGATVEVVGNGQQALDRLRQQPEYFQLVLMDVQMPIMDGFTATKRIRNELKLRVPVLAMTAGVLASEREQCERSGMTGFVAKPIDVAQLLTTIRSQLQVTVQTPPAAKSALPVPQPSAPEFVDLMSLSVLDLRALTVQARTVPGFLAQFAPVLQQTVRNGINQVANAKRAWQQDRPQEAAKLFHSLRGSLGSLGAKHLAALTVQMEAALNDADQTRIEQLFPPIETEVQAALDAAMEWLAALQQEQ